MGKFKRAKKTLPIFYTYLIIVKETNTPIYVGKGHADRVLASNDEYSRKVKRETIYKFSFGHLVEREAFGLERDLILLIGRKDRETGPLLNLTDGGQGRSGNSNNGFLGKHLSEEHRKKIGLANRGRKLSKEHRIKLSLLKKENHHYKGKKRSQETKRKISLALKGRRHSQQHKDKLRLAHFAYKERGCPLNP